MHRRLSMTNAKFMGQQAAEKGCEAALRAPRGRMQGGATKAMPLRIGEERRRRRRPRAAATACGGWPFALEILETKPVLLRSDLACLRPAKGQTRRPHPFSAACDTLRKTG